MKKTVLIIEDDANQLMMLKQLVLSVNDGTEIYTADNEKDAYKILLERTIDLFLVDIILDTRRPGDTSGVRLVEKMRKVQRYMFTPVIFITSLEDPSMYCYKDLNCIGYIEKPYDPDKVTKLIERAMQFSTFREKEVVLTFRRDGILYPVNINKLVYLESSKHMMRIYLSNKSTLDIPYKTIKQILNEADTDCLIQCSRGTLVNKNFISSVDVVNRYITFEDGLGSVEIGLTFKKKMTMEFGNGR